MSQPIYVSPSTTLVQVNPLQIPYTKVYPNSVQFTGQTFTVLDATSSIQVFDNPIVLSTINHKTFTDGSFSTLINQPQGFITLQAQSTFQWGFLNSYPFRNQYVSAGTQFTTLSTLNSQIINANKHTVCTINIENLNVSGRLSISSGVFLYQTGGESVSTFGAANFVSSLFVDSNVFFSSSVSSLGNGYFGSTLFVRGNLTTQSSIAAGEFVNVSTSVFTDGFLYTPYIQLGDGFIGEAINVNDAADITIDVGASASINGSITSLFSKLYVGENIQSRQLQVLFGNFNMLSSAALHQSVTTTAKINILSNVSTLGNVNIGGNLRVDDIFTIPKNNIINSSFFLKDDLTIGTYLSTINLNTFQTAVNKNFIGYSTQTEANFINVDGNLGPQKVVAYSTIVGGSLSTAETFVSYRDTRIEGGLWISSTVSTLREGKTGSWASTLGNLTTTMMGSADLLTLASTLTVENTLVTNCNGGSTIVTGCLSVRRDLIIQNVLTVSSYTLPSSLVTFNVEASTINVGFLGQASSLTTLQNLNTSSLVIGSTQNIRNTAENYLPFYPNSVSTFLFSSLLLQNTYQDNYDAERLYNSLQVTSSFGLGTSAFNNSFEVKPLGYLLSTSYAYQVISTAKIDGISFSGSFQGNGAQLSNIMYPRNLSVGVASISTLFTSNAFISSAFLSSGISYSSTNIFSTLQVNAMNIWGNAYDGTVPSSNIIVAFNSQRALILNNMYIQKPSQPTFPAFVTINPTKIRPGDIYPDIYQAGLEVGNTLRYTEIVGIPADSLIFNEVRAENLFIQHLGSNTFPTNLSNDMYISSGLIRASSTSLFIDQNTSYAQISTNIIQPLFSTLVFNSTLFLKRDTQQVGINQTPNATLDVKSIRLSGNVQATSSLIINDTLQQFVPEGTSLSNVWQQGPLSFSQDAPTFGKVQTNLTDAFSLVQLPLPTASSYPSFMNASSIYLSLNDVLYCDTQRNVGVNTYFDTSSSYQSTFTNSGLVRVSTTTTAIKAESAGLFYSMVSI